MSAVPLSPGVSRTLDAARDIARHHGAAAVEPAHLVHALWQDESRAAEVLAAAGISPERLAALFPLPNRTDAPRESEQPRLSLRVERALRTARSWIRANLDQGEVGTDHLLFGLVESDPECRDRLGNLVTQPAAETMRLPEQVVLDGEADDEPPEPEPTRTPVLEMRSDDERSTGGIARILDAAANRGREGLRVLEDHARFVQNDAHLARELKELRHQLTLAVGAFGLDLHAARDTQGDVGTSIATDSEFHRGTMGDVLRANAKRVAESLRALEEYGKLIDVPAARQLESLRYRMYTLEKALLTAVVSGERLRERRLYFLVDATAGLGATVELVERALAGGVDIVQLREKSLDDRAVLNLARALRTATTAAGALLIINDRPDLALLADADGVHLGQEDLPAAAARRIVGPGKLVGVSTHTIEQARQAVLDGADYLGVGPTFPSSTKSFESFAGLDFVGQAAAEVSLPWFAIGGISGDNIAEVLAAGAARIAVSSALTRAADIKHAARALAQELLERAGR